MRANLAALLLSLSSIAATQSACTEKRAVATSIEQAKHIELPIAYEFGSHGVMLFMNETDGVVAYGNRQPPNWFISGPPSQDHLIACEAKPLRCVQGLTGFKPIVDGNLGVAEQKRFPRLGLQVR